MKNINKFKIDNLTYIFILLSFLSGQLKTTIILYSIIIFHELGHIFIAYIFKYPIKEIIIYPYGGITKIDYKLNDNSIKLIILSMGGVLFQILLYLFNNPLINKYNTYLILFNLIPIIPLDGSKILFEIYTYLFKYKTSMYLLTLTSFIFIILYLIFNYYIFNNYLIVILFISKIIEYFKSTNIFYHKFILERMLYEYGYIHIDNNINVNNYRKGYKYYYFDKNHIISEKDYLLNKYDI